MTDLIGSDSLRGWSYGLNNKPLNPLAHLAVPFGMPVAMSQSLIGSGFLLHYGPNSFSGFLSQGAAPLAPQGDVAAGFNLARNWYPPIWAPAPGSTSDVIGMLMGKYA